MCARAYVRRRPSSAEGCEMSGVVSVYISRHQSTSDASLRQRHFGARPAGMREFADAQRIEAGVAAPGSSPGSPTRAGGRGGRGCRRRTPTISLGDGAVPVPAGPAARREPVASPTPASSRSPSPTPTGRARRRIPVKAKLASGIYHVPGGGNYERTKPDRCYVDADGRGSRRRCAPRSADTYSAGRSRATATRGRSRG